MKQIFPTDYIDHAAIYQDYLATCKCNDCPVAGECSEYGNPECCEKEEGEG